MDTTGIRTTQIVLPGLVEPSGLQVHERSIAEPGPGQALVRVEATGVSFAEKGMRRGRYPGQPPFPFVPGYDLVGTVTAVGPGVDEALAGRRVAALTKTGGWSTYVVLPAVDLVDVPDGVDPADAESMIVNGVTAWQMLHRAARVRAGHTVLVHGASGGVGTVLVQLARLAGATVVGTAAPRHHEELRALGVQPVDYADADLAARVGELAPGGFDAVFDHLGPESFRRSFRLLAAAAPSSPTARPPAWTTRAPCCGCSRGCSGRSCCGTCCPTATARPSTTCGPAAVAGRPSAPA
jgi:synaptic vesicle membrane protein VAT-1